MPSRGVLYYSDNALRIRLSVTCKKYIARSGLPITSVTLKPTNFGRNIVLPLERSYKTMYCQILTGLEAMKEEEALAHRDKVGIWRYGDCGDSDDDERRPPANAWKR
jgi:hypothetical protein